jgi:hypothetical protein
VVDLAVLANGVFTFGLVSRRLEGTILTAPVAFVLPAQFLGFVTYMVSGSVDLPR